MTVVHSDTHTYEQFLKMSVGLGLGLVFVHLFKFSFLCILVYLTLFYSCVVCIYCVRFSFFSTSTILARKNVSKMTYILCQGTYR